MAKFKLSAGAEMDVITKKEMAEVMDTMTRTWMAEVTRGIKHRRFQARASITGGAVTIGSSVDNDLGPANGLYWAVKAVSVTGLAVNDEVQISVNSDPVCSLVRSTGGGLVTRAGFGENELILGPSDTLVASGTGLTATGQVALFGRCAEVPRNLLYKLQ